MIPNIIKLILCSLIILVTIQFAKADYIKLTQFNTDDGLSQNTINEIVRDVDGYLWIATHQGLNRYDGYRISSIHSPENVLENESIEFLWQDSMGLLWISTHSNINFILDRQKNTLSPIELKSPKKDSSSPKIIIKATEDQNNNIWLSSYEEIYFYDRKSRKAEFVFSMKEAFNDPNEETIIRDLLITPSYLLIASSNGLYALNINDHQLKLINHINSSDKNINNNNVKSLHLNAKNKLLVGTVEGLFEINSLTPFNTLDNIVVTPIVDSLNIWKIIEKKNYYWLATDEGLYKLDRQHQLTHLFKFSVLPFDTSDDDIVTMTEDFEGVLWFGSRNDGFFKWHPNQAIKKHYWSNGLSNQQLSNDVVLDIHQDSEQNLWIATENGINKIDQTGKIAAKYLVNQDKKATISDSTIYSITENDNELWLNTFSGIKVLDKGTGKNIKKIFPKTNSKIFQQQVAQLLFISNTELLIVDFDKIYKYNLENNTVHIVESIASKGGDSEWISGVFDVSPNDENSLFMAGKNKLYQFSVSTGLSSVFHSLKDTSQSNESPADIYKDGKNLWVTYSGIGLYILDSDTGEEKHFISEEEMNANTLMDIFSDKKNNLWITSNDGLFKINRENYTYQKFDRNDGFITSEFNGGTVHQVASGDTYLGSMKGAFLFNPNQLESTLSKDFQPKITGVSQLSSALLPQYSDYNNSKIVMQHDDFGLTVKFSALLLDKPEQVKYSYWMEGDSMLSKTTLNRSELFFPSFSPGERKLFISASDYRSGHQSLPISLTIVTKSSPFLSPVAKSIYLILFFITSMIIYLTLKTRQREKALAFKEIKQSEERLSLALKGGNSGLWDWYAENNRVYEPRLATMEKADTEGFIPFRDKISAIFIKDQDNFLTNWREFRAGKIDIFDCVYRMKNPHGKWEWFRDIAMVSEFNSNNLPMRVTGTYTNINEKQKASEQIQLFSKAFENTLDIIIILDDYKKIIAVNYAFENITKYAQDEILGTDISFLIQSNLNDNNQSEIFSSIEDKKQWKGEANLLAKQKLKIPVLVNATIFSASNTTQYYVFAISDISKQKQAELKLKKLANFDSLTNLPNRALFLDRISQAIGTHSQTKKRIAIFFIDLDLFKRVNDSLGHDIGDQVLIRVANILNNCCRTDDTVARLGGDEFVVMLENIDSLSVINRILKSILSQIQEPFEIQLNAITISASIGVSIFPHDSIDPKGLLKNADIAMYHAKSSGKNRFSYFTGQMSDEAEKRLSLETKLRIAIENRDLSLAYQPQFDLLTGEICGVEALARWTTESGEIISPTEFIPIAEELGLIIPLTEYLLPIALEQVTQWNDSNRRIKLAFNLSAIHLYDNSLIKFVEEQIKAFPNTTEILEFELTESILMADIEKALKILKMLNRFNIDLALDDFGTGYSSLKYLTSLPINKLKIDMSFVKKIGESKENDAIINAIISLAKTLNLSVVAEGIESQKQLEFLKREKVNFAQGYLFSKPVDAIKIKEQLDRNIDG